MAEFICINDAVINIDEIRYISLNHKNRENPTFTIIFKDNSKLQFSSASNSAESNFNCYMRLAERLCGEATIDNKSFVEMPDDDDEEDEDDE